MNFDFESFLKRELNCSVKDFNLKMDKLFKCLDYWPPQLLKDVEKKQLNQIKIELERYIGMRELQGDNCTYTKLAGKLFVQAHWEQVKVLL